MDVVVTVVMMDTIVLFMEADMVQIMVRHMQQEVPTVTVVVIMALPSVIQLVIVVILKHDSMFFYITFTQCLYKLIHL